MPIASQTQIVSTMLRFQCVLKSENQMFSESPQYFQKHLRNYCYFDSVMDAVMRVIYCHFGYFLVCFRFGVGNIGFLTYQEILQQQCFQNIRYIGAFDRLPDASHDGMIMQSFQNVYLMFLSCMQCVFHSFVLFQG